MGGGRRSCVCVCVCVCGCRSMAPFGRLILHGKATFLGRFLVDGCDLSHE